jgi:hypothetical protein
MTKKNLFSLLKKSAIIISSGLIFYSCCTKVLCLNAFDMKEIKLTGFTKQETAEILVSSYVQGEGFLNLVDCATTSASSHSGNDNGELIIFVPVNINSKLDYIIRFKTNGLVYKISSINTTMKKCNTCFLTEDNYQVMTNYKINGQQQSKSYFELEK